MTAIYDVQRFTNDGYYYHGDVSFQFVEHDPKQMDLQVVAKFAQPLLTNQNIGIVFMRCYPLQNLNALHAPSRGWDFTCIPSHPTQKDCEEASRELLNIKPDGGLVFGKKAWLGYDRIVLSAEWNDSYWILPEEYLQLIAEKTAKFNNV